MQIQYAKQVELLTSLKLLQEDADGNHFITAIDGKQYPLPDFDEILSRMQKPEMQTKLTQGFDTLLLVPFGLDLKQFTDAWQVGLHRHAATLRTVGAFIEADPLYVSSEYRTDPLVYEPRSFTNQHGGRRKEELLAQDNRGWDVPLVEGALQNLPGEGQGQDVGGRRPFECGRSAAEHLHGLAGDEVGLTPESYVIHFLDALQRRGQVFDTQSFSFLLDAFLPSSRAVPGAYWLPGYGQADLGRGVPGNRGVRFGARAAVRVR